MNIPTLPDITSGELDGKTLDELRKLRDDYRGEWYALANVTVSLLLAGQTNAAMAYAREHHRIAANRLLIEDTESQRWAAERSIEAVREKLGIWS